MGRKTQETRHKQREPEGPREKRSGWSVLVLPGTVSNYGKNGLFVWDQIPLGLLVVKDAAIWKTAQRKWQELEKGRVSEQVCEHVWDMTLSCEPWVQPRWKPSDLPV